jgi:hypothetical protein
MKNTLVIGDLHEPFCLDGYLEFCKRIKNYYKCTRVVFTGDLVDNHAISYHEHDPDGWSPGEEMKETDKKLSKWFKAFPKAYVCLGNHDKLVDRKGKTVGLPKRCFRKFRDMWNLPDGWVDDFHFIFENVLYTHGTGYTGKYAHVTAAFDNRMSTVIGHLHAVAGVEYIANSKGLIFGMSVGCGIDTKAYAFEYGKGFRRKPIVSCGVVSHTSRGTNATVFPMHL